ncbi:MAG: hypothetical protein HN509_10855 [Halobacteriovoraceae bacterium]|jgi:hypothetical protein|nr:hypothetical protein [Halobacteriovoraceae bacterium]MBT5094218.1 hypothetical protein [Halobacteriovoraceae bacterium]
MKTLTASLKHHQRTWLLGTTLFLLAFTVRALLISSARFTFDEASFFEIVHKTFEGEIFPLLGSPVTAGKARMPGSLFFLFMTISQFFSPGPEAVNLFTAFCKALAVLFVWRGLRYRFSRSSSFLVALFFACSPWSILYGERIWNSNLIGFFVAIAFWGSISLRYRYKSWKLIVVMISCGVMPQIHLSAPIVWGPIMALIWPTRKSWKISTLCLGLLGTAFFYIPYLLYEFQNNFSNMKLIFSESVKTKRSFSPLLKVPALLLKFLTLDTSYHELSGYWWGLSERKTINALLFGTAVRPQGFFRILFLTSSFSLLGWMLFENIKTLYRRTKVAGFWRSLGFSGQVLIIGVLFNAAFLIWTGKKVFPHYVQPLMPFTLFLLAHPLEGILLNPPKLKLFSILLGLFCLGGISSSWNISKRLDAKNGLEVHRAVIEKILADIPKKTSSVYLDFNFFSTPESYQILARRSYRRKLLFRDKNSAFHYLLTDGSGGKTEGEKLLTIGPVILYKAPTRN